MIRDDRYIRNNDITVEVPAHINYGKYILDGIRKQPKEQVALINGNTGKEVTYGEIGQYAVDLAVSLADLGTGPGDVVAICCEPREEFVPIVVGVLLTGAAYTPFDHRVGKADFGYKLDLAKPKHVIFSRRFWDLHEGILRNHSFDKHIIIDDENLHSAISIKTLVSKNYNVHHFEPANVDGQKDVALILFSSGSTGYPKGIMITHLTCICNCMFSSFNDPSLKRAISYEEWCHSYDNEMKFRFLTAGKTVVHFNGDVRTLLKCVQDYKPDTALIYPLDIHNIVTLKDVQQYDLNSLRYVYCGTSALSEDLKDAFLKRLPNLQTFVKGYGMTETFELTCECWGVPGLKPKTVGRPAPRITLKVVDVETRKPLGPNKLGELCADAHNIFKGYIGIEPSTYLDDEGFIKTGDLAYYDEDGYFYIVDRLKEIISFNGYKISPVEIEMLLQKYPGVKDAGVVGKPDPVLGEEPTAFVVKEPNCNLTEKDLIDYVNSEIVSHIELRGVRFVEEIPRSSIGKVLRPALKKMLNL